MIAAGVEHMGRVPMGSNVAHRDEFGTPYPPELMARYDLIPQGLSAELIAERWQVSRAEAGRARAALASARCPRDRRGPLRSRDHPDERRRADLSSDQGIRGDTSLDALAATLHRPRPGSPPCPVEGDGLPRPRPLVNE